MSVLIMENKLVTKDSISVINETKYKIDIEELLNEPLKIKVDKKGPQILIYHTHTDESFIKSLSDLKKKYRYKK
jgi:stage II sporulation protein P